MGEKKNVDYLPEFCIPTEVCISITSALKKCIEIPSQVQEKKKKGQIYVCISQSVLAQVQDKVLSANVVGKKTI